MNQEQGIPLIPEIDERSLKKPTESTMSWKEMHDKIAKVKISPRIETLQMEEEIRELIKNEEKHKEDGFLGRLLSITRRYPNVEMTCGGGGGGSLSGSNSIDKLNIRECYPKSVTTEEGGYGVRNPMSCLQGKTFPHYSTPTISARPLEDQEDD